MLSTVAGCGRLGFDDQNGPPDDQMVSGSSPDQIANLIAHWSFDDLTASSIADSIGGNTASCVGNVCPAATTGIVGTAASFDGSTCLRIPSLDTFQGSSFTISSWIQIAGAATGPLVVHENYGGCPSPEMAVTNGSLGLLQLNQSDGHNEAWSPSAMAPTWHHVAVRWDGSEQRLYTDSTCCTLTPSVAPVAASTAEFTIGCYPANSAAFVGAMDEVRLYDRALTSAEIAMLVEVGAAMPTFDTCDALCTDAAP